MEPTTILQHPWQLAIARSAINFALDNGQLSGGIETLSKILHKWDHNAKCDHKAEAFFDEAEQAGLNSVLVDLITMIQNRYVEMREACKTPEFVNGFDNKDDLEICISDYVERITNCSILIDKLC